MPKIHTVAQGESEWLKLRIGKVTASELGNLLTPEFKPRTGEMPRAYLAMKVAEAWRGELLPGFTSWATEQGQLREDEARKWYAFEFDDEHIQSGGFVETDDGRCGCSPDALLGDDSGLELKCPEAPTQVRYLLSGELPKEYACQVHCSLFVTGRPRWRFVSYRRKFPPLVLTIERDDAICAQIGASVNEFFERFSAAMIRLKEMDR